MSDQGSVPPSPKGGGGLFSGLKKGFENLVFEPEPDPNQSTAAAPVSAPTTVIPAPNPGGGIKLSGDDPANTASAVEPVDQGVYEKIRGEILNSQTPYLEFLQNMKALSRHIKVESDLVSAAIDTTEARADLPTTIAGCLSRLKDLRTSFEQQSADALKGKIESSQQQVTATDRTIAEKQAEIQCITAEIEKLRQGKAAFEAEIETHRRSHADRVRKFIGAQSQLFNEIDGHRKLVEQSIRQQP